MTDLFCLPFAGGSKYSYRLFELHAPPGIRILPLEYPGRGTRAKESLLTSLDDLVNDQYQKLQVLIGDQPYALYGHSMGGIIAYQLSRRLMNGAAKKPPLHLFVTGTMGPSCHFRDSRKRHLLPKGQFIEEMRNLDGCPEEILQHEEMLSYLEPILRADFEASESFQYSQQPPLNLPFTVITGTEEDMDEESIRSWQLETLQGIDFLQMPGKHFFIQHHAVQIMNLISGKLLLNLKPLQNERSKNVFEA